MNIPIDQILKIIDSNEIMCNKAGDMLIKYDISIKNPDGTYRGIKNILDDLSLIWEELHRDDKEYIISWLSYS